MNCGEGQSDGRRGIIGRQDRNNGRLSTCLVLSAIRRIWWAPGWGFDDETRCIDRRAGRITDVVEFVRQIHAGCMRDFVMPPAVITRDIDPQSLRSWRPKCPQRSAEVFIEGTEPSVYCEAHGSGIWERVKRSFGFF